MSRRKYARRALVLLSAATGVASSLVARTASATAYTWNGGSGSSNQWAHNTDWQNSVTAVSGAGNVLVFGQSGVTISQTTASNTVSSFTLGEFIFQDTNSSGLILTGSNVIMSSGSSSTPVSISINTNSDVDFLGVSGIALSENLVITGTGTSALTISAPISGATDSVTKSGTSTVIFTGVNTYGGGTTLTAGTLELNASSNAIPGNLTLGTGTVTLLASNQIANGATITINPGGLLNLNNFNDGFGPLNIFASTLSTGTGTATISGNVTSTASTTSSLISGNVSLTAQTTFTVNDGGAASDLTVSANIIGTGGLNKTQTGLLVLSGTDTYSGGTTISAGSLQIGAGAAAGSVSGNITNNGSLIFNRSDSYTFTGSIGGTGSVTQMGAGTVSLTNTNSSYTGGAILDAGTLDFASGGLGTAGTINFASTAALQWASGNSQDISARLAAIGLGVTATFDTNGNAVTLASAISTSNGFAKAGNGTLSLTNTDSFGTTTINAGALQIGVGGTVGSITGNVTDSGTLIFNHSDSLTFAGIVTGSGTLIQAGGGTLTLIGSNGYSGGTTINSGVLQIGAGGAAGSISGNVTDNASLVFNRSDSSAFTGSISGSGSVTMAGAGNLTLSGASSYTGGTQITAGTLSISADNNLGNATASVGISNGATLLTNYSNSPSWARTLSLGTGGGVLNVTSGGFYVTTTIGGGGLTKAGIGDLILNAGASNNNIGTINDNAGRIFVFEATAIGASTINIANGAGLDFALASGANFAPSNTMNFSSGAYLNNRVGTLSISTASTNITSTGTMIFNNDDQVTAPIIVTGTYPAISGSLTLQVGGINSTVGAVTIAGNIGGTGKLFKASTGTLILTGTNTFASSEVDGGVLQVSTSSLPGNVVDNASLVFNQATAGTYTGSISGTGSVTVLAAGTTLTFNNTTSNYSGGTAFDAGTLDFVNGGLGTTGTINFASTAALQWASGNSQDISARLGFGSGVTATFDTNGNAVTLASVISTASNIVKAGAGTLTLTGADTFGNTTISVGALQIGAGGTAGSLGGKITDNGSLVFDLSNAVSSTGTISGSGSLNQIGTGTLTVTGSNTYSGGTTISLGALQIGAGSTAGSLGGNITDNSSLIFNLSSSTNITGTISGSGSVTQLGTGTISLTNAGNNYSAGTALDAGTLDFVNGGLGTTGTINFASTAALQWASGNSQDISARLGFGSGVTATFDTNGNAVTLASVISTASNIVKAGAGTLTLTGADTFGNTTISVGALQIGAGGTAGSLGGNITDNSSLIFNLSSNTNVTGTIGGSGSLTQLGSSTLTVTGSETYSGGTTITGGALQIGAGGATGFISGNITDNSALIFDLAGNLTFTGTITGSGSVTQVGAATLTVTASDTFTGGTTITSGALQIGAGGSTGYIAGNISNSGSLIFDLSNSASFTGTISGGGSVTQLGTGTISLTNAGNNYTGNTTLNAGTLGFVNGALGSGTISFASTAALQWVSGNSQDISARLATIGAGVTATFDTNGNAVTLASAITTSNGFNKAGNGTLSIANADSFGTTTISGGTLQIGTGSSVGSITGNVTDNGNLIFNHADSITYAGIISGNGLLTQAGAGTLTVAASQTYTGGTTISAGALLIGTGGSIGGNVTDNGSLIFNLSSPTTFTGTIGGTGSLTQAGSSTLTLTGSDNYAGGTIINAGALQVGAGAAIGSIGGNVTDNSSLIFNLSNSSTFTGSIGGSGSLTKLGAGTVTLTGANTYSNNTTITAGVLQIGGTNGAIAGNVTDNASLVFNQSSATTFTGTIGGSGSLTQAGAGALTLTGSNNYSGGTTISAGALQIDNGGATGWITGNVTDNASLIFSRADSVTYANVISGSGSLTQNGPGTLILTGSSTFTGGTTINDGQLQIGAGGTTGFINGNIADNAALAYDLSNTVTVTGTISGPGTLTQEGSGTLILTNSNNSYVNGTIVSLGVLQLGNGGTAGPTNGNITDNSAVVFDMSSSMIFAGLISGSGSVNQIGTGTIALNSDNIYSGGTTITAGALQFGVGGPVGSFQGNVTDNGTLIFNRFDAYTYMGTISGSGAVVQEGLGTITLTASNSYSGLTSVTSGALAVSDNNQLGSGSSAIQLTGGALQINGATIARNIALNAGGAIQGTGVSQVNGVITAANSNNLAIRTGSSSTDSLTIGNGANDLTGGGASAIIAVSGSGTVILNQTSNYTGAWNVAGGTLNFSSDATLGSAGSVTLSGGALQFAGSFSSARTISLAASTTGTIDTQAFTDTLASLVTGSGTLNKISVGTLFLTDTSNNYTGGTTLKGGTVNFANNALGTTGPITFAASSTLQWATGNTQDISSRLAAVSSGVTATLDTQANSVTLASALSGSGTFVKNGSGVLALSNASNSHSGGTVINNGTVVAGGPGALGSGVVTLNGGSLTLQPAANTSGAISPLTSAGYGTDVVSTGFFNGQTGLDGSGNSFYTTAVSSTGAMPTSTTILSASNADTHFTFQSYSGNNDLQLGNGATGSLTVSNAGKLQDLSILWADSTAGTATVKLIFSNGAVDTVSGISVPSYSNVSSGYAIHGLGTYNGAFTVTSGANDGLFEFDIAIPTIDQGVTLTNVSFTNNSNNDLNILAISGQATAPSQTAAFYNNAVNVTSNSSINLSSLLNTTMGNLTFGADTLTLTANSIASLTFGSTNLTANAALSPASGVTVTLGGAITGGSNGLTSTGAGTIIYGLGSTDTIANTYTGLTTINSGEILLNKQAGTAAIAGNVSINGGILATNAANQFANGAGVTVTINSGGTFSLGGFSQSLSGLVLTGSNLNGGGGIVTVSGDYNNASFGSGNSFVAKPSNVSSTTINASGGLTQTLSGIGIANGAGPLVTLSLQNSRAGIAENGTFTINGGTLATQPILRGAVLTPGGVTDANPNFAIAVGSTAIETVSLTAAAGTFTQTLTVANNFDNVQNQTLTLTGADYNYATTTIGNHAITLNNFRTASNTVGSFNISNTSLGNLNFQDSLVVNSSGVVSGITGPAAATTIGAGSSTAFTYTANISTANAGAVGGNSTLALVSTPSAGLGLDTVTLGSETVSISGNAYNYAATTIGNQSIALGNFRTNSNAVGSFNVANISLGNLAFQDSLVVNSSGIVSGVTGPGAATTIGAGSSTAFTYTANISSANAGAVSGNSTLALLSTPSAGLGLDTKALGSETVSISGAAYNYANPILATSVNLGNFHLLTGATSSLGVTNAALGNAAFQDNLTVGVASGAIPSVNVTSLASVSAGNSGNLIFTAAPVAAGVISGNETLNLVSNPLVSATGLSGRTTFATVSVSGTAYNYAAASSVPSTISLADVFMNQAVSSTAISITNVAPNTYSESLDASAAASNGLIVNGSVNQLAAGAGPSNNIAVSTDTSFAHAGGGVVTISLNSDGTGSSGLGLTSLSTQTVTVTGGNVLAHAALVDPDVTIRLTQGANGSTTYSISNPLGAAAMRDAANITGVTLSDGSFITTASGLVPTTIVANGSTTYSVTYYSTSSAPTAGNLSFTYGDSQSGLAGANNNNQTLTVTVNAQVDPIVEHVADTSGIDLTTRAVIGTASPIYLTSGQYYLGTLNQNQMTGGVGHTAGTVQINVGPSGNTVALLPESILLFDFGSGSNSSDFNSSGFSNLTSDLTAFGYQYSTDTTSGALGAFDNSPFQPTSFSYDLSVTIANPPNANPSDVDFDFSKYGLQVDNFAAVPEPTSVGLLGGAGIALLSRRRRTRASKR